ncbi:uncharacterized protein LOC126657180 [Mercurialis annua]|uniref:uncharacterized protein LOC126657180 n=1 Tax=Mercurialis annua TaxID=3986 RepID=UPI00215E75DD|nr:uncharacterized protein LOC126657180 [Mercurialis annua]
MIPEQRKKSWHSIVWFAGQIPRHSFITWMALLGRLNTKDRIMKWGVVSNSTCSLCNQQNEDIEHLFFACRFSSIWEKVLQISDRARQRFTSRREVSYIVRRTKEKSIRAKVMKLWFNASVYHVWMARNKIVFAQENQIVDQVFNRIEADPLGLLYLGLFQAIKMLSLYH